MALSVQHPIDVYLPMRGGTDVTVAVGDVKLAVLVPIVDITDAVDVVTLFDEIGLDVPFARYKLNRLPAPHNSALLPGHVKLQSVDGAAAFVPDIKVPYQHSFPYSTPKYVAEPDLAMLAQSSSVMVLFA